MSNSIDKSRVNDRLEALYVKADAYFNRRFARPTVTYRRSGKHAGTAFLHQNRINLNPILFVHNEADYFTDVIPHEASHLLVYQVYGNVKPHGEEWRTVMSEVFHCSPNARHNFDLTPLNIRTVTYRCNCGHIELSLRRHNAVARGKRNYQCKTCGMTLVQL